MRYLNRGFKREQNFDEGYEVKSYIPHKLITLNSQISQNGDDKVLMECFRKAFDWANQMGLEGKRVFDFYFERPDPSNPFAGQSYIWCKIECTEEERKYWEEMREIKIKLSIYDALNEE